MLGKDKPKAAELSKEAIDERYQEHLKRVAGPAKVNLREGK